MSDNPPLTPDMKAVLALEIIFVIFLIVIASPIPTGETPQFAVQWLALTIPYLVLLYFGWSGRGSAFLGSSVVSVALIIFVAVNVHGATSTGLGEFTPTQVWGLVSAQILLALISLEGFKAYVQSKGSANQESAA